MLITMVSCKKNPLNQSSDPMTSLDDIMDHIWMILNGSLEIPLKSQQFSGPSPAWSRAEGPERSGDQGVPEISAA